MKDFSLLLRVFLLCNQLVISEVLKDLQAFFYRLLLCFSGLSLIGGYRLLLLQAVVQLCFQADFVYRLDAASQSRLTEAGFATVEDKNTVGPDFKGFFSKLFGALFFRTATCRILLLLISTAALFGRL